jgi:hypothetical protein
MFDQNDPTKRRSQEHDKPSEQAQDGREHGETVLGFRLEVLGSKLGVLRLKASTAYAARKLQPPT